MQAAAMRKAAAVVGVIAIFAVANPVSAGWRVEGAGKYIAPTPVPQSAAINSRELDVSRDAAWTALVSYMSRASFAIDQVSKESGLLTIKFSAPDPTVLVNCGTITSWVSNLRGRRDYSFEGASANETYETFERGTLFGIDRTVRLSGGVNIFIVAASDDRAIVRVNARYALQKHIVLHDVATEMLGRGGRTVLDSTIAFNTGEEGIDDGAARATRCVGTFSLERQILDGITAEIAATAKRR